MDDGSAKFMVWSESQLIELSWEIPDVQGTLIEPTSLTVHAARRSGTKIGDTVAVIGCGTMRILTMQVLRVSGYVHDCASDLRK